jgi:hypothetical protein
MNGRVKCVENPSTHNECMHVKCKFVIKILWSNFIGIKLTSTNVLNLVHLLCFVPYFLIEVLDVLNFYSCPLFCSLFV